MALEFDVAELVDRAGLSQHAPLVGIGEKVISRHSGLPRNSLIGSCWTCNHAGVPRLTRSGIRNPRAFKGGAVEWVFWQTGSAQLLPRLLAGRTGGPVFLGDRRPTRPVAGLDLDPTSGRARLSYRRAAELFQARTGRTLHQLRHSALTYAAEDGTNLPLLLARSRHASVCAPWSDMPVPDPRRSPATSPRPTRHAADRDPPAPQLEASRRARRR